MTDKTLDYDDDLTPMQEYVTAGIVILLFGLLYWFLNHDWTTENNLLANSAKVPVLETNSGSSLAIASKLGMQTKPATNTDTSSKQVRPEVEAKTGFSATAPQTETSSSIPMKTVANLPPSTTEPPQIKEDPAKTATMQVEIDKLKTENAALKQAVEANRIKTEQTAQQQAVAPPSPATTQPTEQVTAEDDVYTLPDGTEVTLADTGLEQDFKQAIQQQKTDTPMVFDNIYFDTGSIALNPASDHQIKAVAALLYKHPDIKIMLRGHTDNVGLPQANSQLSLLRANSVGLALVNLGIDRQRIRIMGMGDTNPLASNATEEGRQQNRRIDISLIK